MTHPGANPYLPPPLPERRISPALIGALVVAVLAVAGLAAWLFAGRDSDAGTVPVAAGASSTPSAAPKAPATSAPADKAKTTGLRLGSKATVPATADLSSATVQVLAYKRDASLGEEAAVDAVQIRICLGKEHTEETTVSAGPWSLIYGGGESRHQEISTGGPSPAWPTFDERALQPGSCVKGWLAFTDIEGKPDGVEYKLDSGFTASWRL